MTIMCNRSRIWTSRSRNMEFRSVFAANCHFWYNRRLTLLDFELKFDFFLTHKNLYTWILCVTDPKYGLHDQKIWSFGQFFAVN
jgi:hypothetical protein